MLKINRLILKLCLEHIFLRLRSTNNYKVNEIKKQKNILDVDKERVAAAMENQNLIRMINKNIV